MMTTVQTTDHDVGTGSAIEYESERRTNEDLTVDHWGPAS